MKKLYIIGIVVLVLLAAFYFFVIRPAPATAAILYVENGTVQVDQGKGWQPGIDELELSEGDKVKTSDGEATIVFWEGEIMHLEPNTEVSLDDISSSDISVSQLAGETWNKVTRISGVKEYNVQTPTAVATVRGTEFFVGQEDLAVLDGEVDYGPKAGKNRIKLGPGKKAKALSLVEEDITPEELERYKKFTGKYEKILIKLREREIKKNRSFLKLAEKRGVSEDQLRQRLTDIDENRENEDDAYGQVPAMLKPRAKRAYLLTKEIKRAKAAAP